MQATALPQAGQSSSIHRIAAASRLILSVVVMFTLICSPVPVLSQSTGRTFYVSQSGSDSNPGTQSAPWQTILKAAANLVAGDTAIIMNGTYTEPEIAFRNSGTPTQGITIRAQNKWGAVISSISSCAPNISVYGSYVIIDGLSLVINPANVYCTPNSASGTGVRAWRDTGGTNVIVRNLKTDNPSGPSGTIRSHGIKSNQHNSLLEDNELAAGLEIIGNDIIVRRNHITGGGQWGNGIVAKGGTTNAQIYNNVIEGGSTLFANGIVLGGQTGGITAPECQNCVAWDNVVIVMPSAYGDALAYQGADQSAFFNNVAINRGIGMSQGITVWLNSNNTWKNNIIYGANTPCTQSLSGSYTIDYNNFFNCTSTPTQANPITGDPQFVNPQSNWEIKSGSPALGSGVLVSFTGFAGAVIDVSKDKQGVIRTVPWSLGIYAGSAATTPPAPPSGLVVN